MRRNAGPKGGIALSLFLIGISMLNYSRLQGSNCIRPIHVVTLLVCGIAIGVLLVNVLVLFKKKQP